MSKLTDILSEVLNAKDLTDETKLKDIPAWDSMNHMILITQLEEGFSIEFDSEEIVQMDSVGFIKDALAKKGVDAAG